MKKFIYTVLAVAMVALVGCNKKAKDEVRVYPESAAAKAVALGTFDGDWSRVEVDSEDAATIKKGTIAFAECKVDSIIAKAGADNVAMVTAVCADLDLNSTGVVNIMHAGNDIIFQNNKGAGGFGVAVFGRIQGAYTDSPKVTMSFKIEKRNGLKLKTYMYDFK